MSAAMEEVGRRFSCNEICVPEMLISTRAMKEATALATVARLPQLKRDFGTRIGRPEHEWGPK